MTNSNSNLNAESHESEEQQIPKMLSNEIRVSQSTNDVLKAIFEAETEDPLELAKIAGLDPSKDYAKGNYTGSDLSNVNLSGINLSGANFSGVNLSGANLSGADLNGANLSKTNLSKANLCGANLSEADITDSDLSEAKLTRTFVSCANLSRSNLTGATLIRANLSGANLSDALLGLTSLQGANLSYVDFSNADLHNATLTNANLRDSNLKGSILTNADFEGTVVEGTRFRDNSGLSPNVRINLIERGAVFVDDIRAVLLGWETLNDHDRDWLIETGESKDLLDGTILIKENGSIDALYIVLRGKLKVSVLKTKQCIAELSGGEVVGEMSFLKTLPPSATVEAVQNSCVWSIRRELLLEQIIQDREFGCRFYQALATVLSGRLKQTTLALIEKDEITQRLTDDRYALNSLDNSALASLLINGLIEEQNIDS